MVGDRDELARREPRLRLAGREHRHHQTDDGAARQLREEREQRALERRGRAQLLPRELEQPGAWEQGGAGGAARRAGSVRTSATASPATDAQSPSPARLALSAWMASTGVGSTPYSSAR